MSEQYLFFRSNVGHCNIRVWSVLEADKTDDNRESTFLYLDVVPMITKVCRICLDQFTHAKDDTAEAVAS